MKTIYVHYRNHKPYCKCRQEVMIQINNEWVPAVLYYSMHQPNKYFVRSKEEFEAKFMAVQLPDTHPLPR